MKDLDSIYFAVRELPPEERSAWLARACGDDAGLRARVEQMLALAREAESFIGEPADAMTTVLTAPAERAGDCIGRYKLLQQIGEGGFGTVWMAEQEHPVRRRVALKIIKLGMDTQEVNARFEQERQALAMMDHSSIAKVFDAGATPNGRPFFVMELVRGVKITDYCDEQQLATPQRLALFILVCQAVQHAHQKGIIHRDLKPSNILVTINDGEPIPKVIDFGVAKATQGRLTEATLFTRFEQMVGTPLYMSPEQAELTSLDIDTRSDIYSLGVLLYELLTGRTPIDSKTMAQAGMDEIRRIIREVDPPRPSARIKTLAGNELTTAAKRRHTEAARLPGVLRGDLDWIVMKCLEKDRKRRYDTANGLALDLQRHLANEIVTARPPTAAYLFGKLIRRNKLAFAAGAAVAASLIVGIVATAWQAVRANREANRVTGALEDLRATAPAFAEQARALVAREQFGEAVEKLAYAAKLRPDVPDYLIAQGDVYQCQVRLAEAAAAYRAALAVHPGDVRAGTGAALCDELLAAPPGKDGKLTRESLSKLHLAMQQQQRPAAELMPVARLLGEEKKLIVDYWMTRLKELPISADNPLEKRLSVREDGLLALDLRGTKVSDLKPLAGMPLGSLNLGETRNITNFTPLSGFQSLHALDLTGTGIENLSPLRGLPLDSLVCDDTSVFEITALRGMPLKKLSIRGTRIADLTPLAGMPLTFFDGTAIPATDYTPLTGAPLEECILQNSPIRDLSFLRDSPVKQLILFNCNEARGFAVLPGLKSLDLLILPQSFRGLPEADLAAIGSLRTHPVLKNIQTEWRTGSFVISSAQSKDDFWKDWDREQSFVPALRKSGFQFSMSKTADGNYRLYLERQAISDLSLLKGAPVSELWVGAGKVTDLTPLKDLPLRVLGLWSNPRLEDLRPLRGLRLEELSLEDTKVSDLSPLAGMPLKKLFLHSCENLTDISPLAEIATLEKLTVPLKARNISVLRKLPHIKWLGFQADPESPAFPISTAEQFWKNWPAMSWLGSLNDAGTAYTAHQHGDKSWEVTVTAKEFKDCSLFKGAALRELTLAGTSVTSLAPLVGLPLKKLHLQRDPLMDLSPVGDLALNEVSVRDMDLADISFLRRAPLCESLESLSLERVKVVDFSPVAACKSLTLFAGSGTPLASLEPLSRLPLHALFIAGARVRDISLLAEMPLTKVFLDGLDVTDVSPLLKCPTLKEIILPRDARDVQALCKLPNLRRISYKFDDKAQGPSMTVAEFLAELPGRQAGTPLAQGHYAEAEQGFAETLAASRKRFAAGDAALVPAILNLANCRAWAGHCQEAIPLFREIIALRKGSRGATPDTGEILDWYALALMHAASRDGEGYRAVCTEMLRRCGDGLKDNIAERVLQYCSLAPGGGLGKAQLRSLIETSRPMERTSLAYWFRIAVGLAEFRDGNFSAAADALQKVERLENSSASSLADLTLAMLSHHAGNKADAVMRLERSRATVAAHWPLRQENAADVRGWHNWMAAQILLQEAEAMIADPAGKSP